MQPDVFPLPILKVTIKKFVIVCLNLTRLGNSRLSAAKLLVNVFLLAVQKSDG